MERAARMSLRLVAIFLALTAPFFVYNLSQGMDPEQSLRSLPSSYERAFHWTAQTLAEQIGDMETPTPDSVRPAPGVAGGGSPTPSHQEQNGVETVQPNDAEIEGLEDGRQHIPLMESIVLERTNHYRQQEGVGTLAMDSELSDIARAHSEDMAEHGYFAHENLQGQSPSDRASAAGYDCRKIVGLYITQGVGENLFRGALYSSYTQRGSERTYNYMTAREIAELAVSRLMDSPGHRENILHESYDLLGVGIAVSEDQEVYVTQKFC